MTKTKKKQIVKTTKDIIVNTAEVLEIAVLITGGIYLSVRLSQLAERVLQYTTKIAIDKIKKL